MTCKPEHATPQASLRRQPGLQSGSKGWQSCGSPLRAGAEAGAAGRLAVAAVLDGAHAHNLGVDGGRHAAGIGSMDSRRSGVRACLRPPGRTARRRNAFRCVSKSVHEVAPVSACGHLATQCAGSALPRSQPKLKLKRKRKPHNLTSSRPCGRSWAAHSLQSMWQHHALTISKRQRQVRPTAASSHASSAVLADVLTSSHALHQCCCVSAWLCAAAKASRPHSPGCPGQQGSSQGANQRPVPRKLPPPAAAPAPLCPLPPQHQQP